MDRRPQRTGRVDAPGAPQPEPGEDVEENLQGLLAGRAVLLVIGGGRPDGRRVPAGVVKDPPSVGIGERVDRIGTGQADAGSRQRGREFVFGLYGDAAAKRIQGLDVLVERRRPYADALGEQTHRQAVEPDLVGEGGAGRDDRGRCETGPRHGRSLQEGGHKATTSSGYWSCG